MGIESNIQNAIESYLKYSGYIVWRLNAGKFYVKYGKDRGRMIRGCERGVPDLIVLHNGITEFIEVKSPKGKVSKIQKDMHDKLNNHGFKVHVLRSIDECMEIF